MPAGMLDTLKMLPMLARLKDLMPKTVSSAAVPGSGEEGRHARRDPDPEVLARGRRRATSRCRWSSPAIPRPACATSARTACRCSTAARRACTGSGTRGARSTTAIAERLGKRMPVAVALGADPALPFAATAPMPEGLDELLLAGFLRRERVELVKCVTNDLEVPGQRADRPRGLRRSRRAAARRAVRRSHRLLLAPRRLPGLPRHLRHAPQEPDLPDDRRRHSADGGLLPRQGERADLPAAHQEDGARRSST